MGLETFLIVSAASVGLSALSADQAQDAAYKQAEAEQEELFRQREEADRQAAREASDLAREMDAAAAKARVAMEALGGAGSVNDLRAQAEIAGLKSVDIARIEANRTNRAEALASAAKASRRTADFRADQATARFLGDALGIAGGAFAFSQRQAGREAQQTRARRNI